MCTYSSMNRIDSHNTVPYVVCALCIRILRCWLKKAQWAFYDPSKILFCARLQILLTTWAYSDVLIISEFDSRTFMKRSAPKEALIVRNLLGNWIFFFLFNVGCLHKHFIGNFSDILNSYFGRAAYKCLADEISRITSEDGLISARNKKIFSFILFHLTGRYNWKRAVRLTKNIP